MLIKPIQVSAEVESLLSAAGLPVSDVHDADKITFFGLHDNGKLIAVIGVEQYTTVALLRSLAVNRSARQSGCGSRLVSELEVWCAERGVEEIYLLTTDASDYFTRAGYSEVCRDLAPRSIADTSQFSSLCPTTATVMVKALV